MTANITGSYKETSQPDRNRGGCGTGASNWRGEWNLKKVSVILSQTIAGNGTGLEKQQKKEGIV
jgi:hypothetical protein